MPSGVGAPNSIVSAYPSGPGVRSARVARNGERWAGRTGRRTSGHRLPTRSAQLSHREARSAREPRRNRSVDDGDHATGLDPAHPRGDLGGEGGLSDAAHLVDDQPATARSGQVGGPATAFGRTDGQRCPVPGPGVRASRVAGRVPDPDRPGRRPACVIFWGFSGPGVRAAGISCGRTACSGTAFSRPTRTNLATSTPLPRTPADGASSHAFCIAHSAIDWMLLVSYSWSRPWEIHVRSGL